MKRKRTTAAMRLSWSSSVLQALILVVPAPYLVSSQQCTLCLDGSAIPNPDRKFEDGDFEDCAALGGITGLLGVGTPLCDSVQKLGTICGCAYPETACTLCYDGSRVTNATRETDVLVAEYLLGASEGERMNCETLEAVMHHEDAESAVCIANQLNVSEQCGCPPPPDDLKFNQTSEGTSVTDPPLETCSICIDGGNITKPDRPLDFGEESPVSNCRDLAESAVYFPVGSTSCTGIRNIGTYCGCTFKRNDCTLCPNGEPVPYPQRKVPGFPSFSHIEELGEVDVGSFLTCGVYEAFMENIEGSTLGASSEQLCLSGHARSRSCGCSPGWRQVLLVWCYRSAGILSLIGSLSIMLDIARSSNNKIRNTYHQFLLGISTFDILSSIMYILAGVMLPEMTGYYEAHGNDTSCRIQGFVLQLGLTSVFYNAMLSSYFFLVICCNWKEEKLRRMLPYCHAAVNCIGIGLAIGGLWFYGEQRAVCYVTVPLVAKSWLPIAFFNTTPIALALLIMTGSTVMICRKVYGVNQKSRRWSVSSSHSRNGNTSKLVFWQSVWYAMSFLLTLPFLMIAYYVQFQFEESYWFAVISAILAPAQGFMNALVYYKRKYSSKILCTRCACCHNTEDSTDDGLLLRSRRSLTQDNLAGVHRRGSISSSTTPSGARHRWSIEGSTVAEEFAAVKECWEITRGDSEIMISNFSPARGSDDDAPATSSDPPASTEGADIPVWTLPEGKNVAPAAP